MTSAMAGAHGLVVGIAAYQNVQGLPSTVVKDARNVYDLLTDPAAGGYPPAQTKLLLDADATRAGMLDALGSLATSADADSTVVVYLSSHGGRVESGEHQGEYILPVDTVVGSERALAESAISGDEFGACLAAIPARKVVVIFDCCHAGGIGRPKDATAAVPDLKPGLPERYYEALQSGRGRVILASSRSTELSWVLAGHDNSLFTHHLLAGLRGGIASDDGLVRVFDLFEYLQPRVTADQHNQHPVFKADLEENFPVALWLGGQKGAIAKDVDGYRYDAYISYVDREPDTTWVWDTLVPRLEQAGLRLAVSGDVEQPGVDRVVGIERGITQSKRTVVVLSPLYLEDGIGSFENVLSQSIGVQEGTYRLLPVTIGGIDEGRLPARLAMLSTVDLVHPRRAERNFERLVEALQGPLPRH